MIDYALWEVIENGATLPKTTTVEGVVTEMPITTAKEKAQRRLEDAKKLLEAVEKRFGFKKLVSQLELLDEKLSQEDVNQKLLRSLSPEWNTHAVVWRNKVDLDTISMDDLYNNLKVYESEVKGMSNSSSSTQNKAFVSSSNNNTSSTNEAVNIAHGVSTASTQVNATYFINIDNLNDVVICIFLASQPNSPQLVHEDFPQIHPDDMEEMDLRWQMAILTMRARRILKNTGRKANVKANEIWFAYRAPEIKTTRTRKSQEGVCMWKHLLPQLWCHVMVLVDMTRVIRQRPNYALMAYSSSSSDSEVSNDSNCSKSCMETVKLLKSQNDQLLRDLEKSSLMVLGYKTGLELVEEKLEFYKKNESIYVENINGLKWDIQIGEIQKENIRELRKKLKKIQKEKDSIQFNVDKFENASNSLNKLIECQIVDNCKKSLGYEKYNAVPPPYTGNFMPQTPDLSFTGLDEFVNKPVVGNKKSNEEVSKGNPQMDLQDQRVIDSGCSRNMSGNMSYLTDYKEIDGRYVAFGGNPKGGKSQEKVPLKLVI
ncbi:hypothetical protein Tco_0787503 [Tanacetum coccineum]